MKPREQRQLSRLQTWVSGRACLFKEEISRTGRVLLSTSDNKCTRGSSRTAGSKGKSRKVEKTAFSAARFTKQDQMGMPIQVREGRDKFRTLFYILESLR